MASNGETTRTSPTDRAVFDILMEISMHSPITSGDTISCSERDFSSRGDNVSAADQFTAHRRAVARHAYARQTSSLGDERARPTSGSEELGVVARAVMKFYGQSTATIVVESITPTNLFERVST